MIITTHSKDNNKDKKNRNNHNNTKKNKEIHDNINKNNTHTIQHNQGNKKRDANTTET